MVHHPKQNCLQTLQIKLSYVVVEYVVAQGFQFFFLSVCEAVGHIWGVQRPVGIFEQGNTRR